MVLFALLIMLVVGQTTNYATTTNGQDGETVTQTINSITADAPEVIPQTDFQKFSETINRLAYGTSYVATNVRLYEPISYTITAITSECNYPYGPGIRYIQPISIYYIQTFN